MSEADKIDKKAVYFLPYFPINKEIRVANFLFWPFYRMKDKYIQDEDVRTHLEKIFGCYVDRSGEITCSITIASIDNQFFSPFPEEERKKLALAVKALAFASIVKNPYRYQYRNSENFQIYSQEFVPGEEILTAVQRFRRNAYGGHVHRSGPYKFEQVKFIQPDSVLICGTKEVDQRLLTALEKVLESRESDRDAERILRALEWFYFSNFDLRDIPDTAVIVMRATAFESLLDISGTADFVKKVEKFVAHKARRFLDESAIRFMS